MVSWPHLIVQSLTVTQADIPQRFLKDSLLSFYTAQPPSGYQTLLLTPVCLCPLSLLQQKHHISGTQATESTVTGIGARVMISTQIFSVGKALLVSTIFLDVENQARSILYRHVGDGITSIRRSPLVRVHGGRRGVGEGELTRLRFLIRACLFLLPSIVVPRSLAAQLVPPHPLLCW